MGFMVFFSLDRNLSQILEHFLGLLCSKHSEPLLLPIHVEQRRLGEVGRMGFLQVGERISTHESSEQRVAADDDEQRLRAM